MFKIVYQGGAGAFSHIAAVKFFGKKNVFVGVKKFEDIFIALKNKKADFGIVPIENSIAGSIYENYDLLVRYKFFVVGELYLKVSHNLLGVKAPSISKNERLKIINKVFSHYKALEQCSNFFKKHPWIEKVEFEDTALAAQLVSNSQNFSYGAIASNFAGELYNLEVILKNIEDNHNNFTRFLIISRKNIKEKKPNKCSLVFYLKHKPGSLYKILKIFAENNINLTKIESRPIRGKIFEYLFYLDFEFKEKKLNVSKIIEEMKKEAYGVFVLGIYTKGKYF